MIPLKVAIIVAFLFNRYKFLSRIEDKNLHRLPKRTLYALRSGAVDRYQGPHTWTSWAASFLRARHPIDRPKTI
ncbi:hypothetical protein KAI37_02535 [Paenibacillus sp. S25]|nr:hypothetical protein KAI37_02535 [Paenibacillus sp. S25]